MIEKVAPTYRYDIYMAGDINIAKEVCQLYCNDYGECVHIEPVDYIYTNGNAQGFKVGFINYPRFPRDSSILEQRSKDLANRLLVRLDQQSYSIVGPETTYFYSIKPEHHKQ